MTLEIQFELPFSVDDLPVAYLQFEVSVDAGRYRIQRIVSVTLCGYSFADGVPVNPPARNALNVDLDGVSAVTFWVEEANIDPDELITLRVDSTDEATITLAGSFGKREVTVPAGHTEMTVQLLRGEQ